MNLNEFLEMKNEFAEYIYRYEYFLKCGAINDCYYTHFFSKFLNEIRTLGIENEVMSTAIKMKSEGKSDEEINEYINKAKEGFSEDQKKIDYKTTLAEQVVANNEKLSIEDKKQFEIDYLDYVKKNHPIVKCLATEAEENAFNMISKLYKENNYYGFKSFIDMNKAIFTNPDYKEQDFNKISAYYYDIKKNINTDYQRKQNMYPYNKQDTLKNEISIARENGDLKAKLNEYKGINKSIRQDYVNYFKQDFSLK